MPEEPYGQSWECLESRAKDWAPKANLCYLLFRSRIRRRPVPPWSEVEAWQWNAATCLSLLVCRMDSTGWLLVRLLNLWAEG